MKTTRKLWIRIGIVLAIAGIGTAGWYFMVRPSGSLHAGLVAAWNSLVNPVAIVPTGGLNASGTVETTVLSIASEMTGKVVQVNFQEGDVVKAGAVLVHLDDGTLQIQHTIAADKLETAKLSLLQLASPTVIANLQHTIAQDKQAIDDAQQVLDTQNYYTTNTDAIENARTNLYLAREALNHAQDVYDSIKYNNDKSASDRAAAYQKVYRSIEAYKNALAQLNLWTGVPNQEQVDLKTANLALAIAKLEEDQTLMEALNGGSIPENATGAGMLQLKKAQINVQAAQANLELLDDEIAKMTVTAPVDGLVMSRSVDPGNVVIPGTELLSLARLNDLTINVYIPEDSYKNIQLGQTAAVAVDTFPGKKFTAEVVSISAKPQFIPRTARTVSGSKSTLYAIQLKLSDATGKLKPGMSADVSFNLK